MSANRRLTSSFLRCLLPLIFCASQVLSNQSLGQALSGTKSSGAPAAPVDPLKRTTPRSSIYNFLEECHADRYVQAARYLDLRRIPPAQRTVHGPELARELADILDRDPSFEVDHLSDSPEGNMEDGLAPDTDTLLTVQVSDSAVTLYMQRVQQQGMSVWLVSADSVARLPELEVLAGESPIEKKLPAVLVETKLLNTALWIWLALVGSAILLSLLSRLLSRAFIGILRPLAKRYAKSPVTQRWESFIEPLRLLLAVVVFRAVVALVTPSALLRDYLLKMLTLLFALGAAAFTMRVVDVISDQLLSRMSARERALSYSVLPLAVRVVKICIFCVAVLFTLAAWGYNTNTILAGVGVGGLAVALAAQKTIENLFGGVSLISDRPVLVGDFCQFGGQVGTVEDIGLRSTRIRTLDRTLVTIPNSQFSTMTLENYSRRDRIWFHPTLRLRRDTSASQVRTMMEAFQKILEEHPMVDASGVPLRFTKINDQSLDIETFAYVLTSDGNQYLKVQSELLLKFLEASDANKVGFAVPITESLSLTVQPGESPDGFRPLSITPRADGNRTA